MLKYTFYWNDGRREILNGQNVFDALTKAGYTGCSLKNLAFYFPDENNDFYWDEENKKWIFGPDHSSGININDIFKKYVH